MSGDTVTRSIIMRPAYREGGKTMRRIIETVGVEILATVINWPVEDADVILTLPRCIECTYCGAAPETPCRTKTGRATANHINRVEDGYGIIFAAEDDSIITEEPDAEDLLA